MITDIEELQHLYYSDWQRDDGSRSGQYCKFCCLVQHDPMIEMHMPACERLEYIDHFYGVKSQKSSDPNRKHLVVHGSEFTRSGVYGWWTSIPEFKPLLAKAFQKEKR